LSEEALLFIVRRHFQNPKLVKFGWNASYVVIGHMALVWKSKKRPVINTFVTCIIILSKMIGISVPHHWNNKMHFAIKMLPWKRYLYCFTRCIFATKQLWNQKLCFVNYNKWGSSSLNLPFL
jgi:hypothetical protein